MDMRFRCDPMLDALPRPRLARHALPEWLRTMPVSSRPGATASAAR